MGNEIGQPSSTLAFTSLAVTTPNIEMKEIDKLFQLMKKVAAEKQSEMISRDELYSALKQVEKFTPSDSELFVQLFVLFDEQGQEAVEYKSFIVGAGVCLSSAPLTDRLKFALSVYDVNEKQYCQRADLKKTLAAINTTAAYFGDPVLLSSEIEVIILEAFKVLPSVASLGVSHDDCIAYLLKDPLVIKFMNAEGTVRFGSSELTSTSTR